MRFLCLLNGDNEAKMPGMYHLIDVSNFPSPVSSSLPLLMPSHCSWWISALIHTLSRWLCPLHYIITFALYNLCAALALSLLSLFFPTAFFNSFSSPAHIHQSWQSWRPIGQSIHVNVWISGNKVRVSEKDFRRLENVYSAYKYLKHNTHTHTICQAKYIGRLDLANEQPFCIFAFQRNSWVVTVSKSQVALCCSLLNLSCNCEQLSYKNLLWSYSHISYIRNHRPTWGCTEATFTIYMLISLHQ